MAVLEQAAIESKDVLAEGGAKSPLVHACPQAVHRRLEMLRMVFQAAQHLAEAVFRQQPDIFGEHRKEAAHQKGGDALRVVTIRFEAAAQ